MEQLLYHPRNTYVIVPFVWPPITGNLEILGSNLWILYSRRCHWACGPQHAQKRCHNTGQGIKPKIALLSKKPGYWEEWESPFHFYSSKQKSLFSLSEKIRRSLAKGQNNGRTGEFYSEWMGPHFSSLHHTSVRIMSNEFGDLRPFCVSKAHEMV